MAVTTWSFGAGISRTLTHLRKGANIVAAGNLHDRQEVASQDETSHVALALNGMTQALGTSRAELQTEISERARVEERVAQVHALTLANRRLQEMDQLKSEFLATLSHELRTPLNTIIGFTGTSERISVRVAAA